MKTFSRHSVRKGLAVSLTLLMMGPLPIYAQEHQESLKDAIEQALLYYKRDRIKRARIEFERARRLPGGMSDGALHYYLAQTYARLGLIDRAFPAAQSAHDLSAETPRLSQKAKRFLEELNSLYGAVHFRADDAQAAPVGSIELESKGPIINREKRRQYQSVRERFRTTLVRLPLTTYLPYGTYQANQVQFSVSLGEVTTVNLNLVQIAGAKAPESERNSSGNLWLYIGMGVGLAAAVGVGGWFLFKPDEASTSTEKAYPILIRNLEAR